MHFYDAELLRLRAHVQHDPRPGEPTLTPRYNSPAARAPPCSNFVRPSTTTSYAENPPVPH
jgi:hypothetical protein